MKNRIDTQRLVYLTFITLAAFLIGILIGTVDAVFGQVLSAISAIREAHPLYLTPFLALGGLLIVFLYDHFGGTSGKGINLVFEVADKKEREIPKRLVPLVMLATWITHLFGGSAGREGVAVQLGATISHAFSPFFHSIKSPRTSRTFLIMGMAAGFAGLFQTPIAAIMFAMEVLIIGHLDLWAILPTCIAAFTASTTSHLLGLEKFSHAVQFDFTLDGVLFLKLAILGLCFGFAGTLFAFLLRQTKLKLLKTFKGPYQRIFILSLLLSSLLLICGLGRYSGLGTNLVAASFSGEAVYPFDWLLKLLLTVLTLAAGFQGGEVTPLFTIGATLGSVLAPLIGLPLEFVAALGFCGVFGSATGTFLAPIFICGETFGFENTPYIFIVVCFAFLIKKDTSIYSLQKISDIK